MAQSYTRASGVDARAGVAIILHSRTHSQNAAPARAHNQNVAHLQAQAERTYAYYFRGFISSPNSSTGWVNLPSLGASLPCNTGSYFISDGNDNGIKYASIVSYFQIRFPHLTGSFNYSTSTNDFEIYSLAGFGPSGSIHYDPQAFPLLCPDPSGSKIYSYIAGVPTVYTSSYFVGGSPTLIIAP